MSTGLSATLNIISTSPFNLSQNSCTICLLAGTASVVNLPILSTQIYQIQFVNLLSTAVTINSNVLDINPFSVTIPGTSFINIFPNNLTQNWIILGQGATNIVPNPFLRIDGTNSMTGNLNVPSSNVLVGNQTGLPNSSAICLRQTGQLNNNAGGSTQGIKFYNAGSTDAFYLGYAVGGTFSVFQQTSGGVYTKLASFGPSGIDMNNLQIRNTLNPSANQDVATKSYVDSAIAAAVSAKYNTLIGSIVNSTAAGFSLGLLAPVNATFRVLINAYNTNFSSWSTNNYICQPGLPGGFILLLAPVTSPISAPGLSNNLNNVIYIQIQNPSSVGSTLFNGFATLASGATGYDIYVYN